MSAGNSDHWIDERTAKRLFRVNVQAISKGYHVIRADGTMDVRLSDVARAARMSLVEARRLQVAEILRSNQATG